MDKRELMRCTQLADSARKKKVDFCAFNTEDISDFSEAFYYDKGIEKFDFTGFSTNKAENMRAMFAVCSSVKNLDLSGFNTENATNMKSMFYHCPYLKCMDLGAFNMKGVKNSRNMFNSANSEMKVRISSASTSIGRVQRQLVRDGIVYCTFVVYNPYNGKGVVWKYDRTNKKWVKA